MGQERRGRQMNGTVARTFDEERYLAETGYISYTPPKIEPPESTQGLE